jgi:hypothetical protein
MVTKVHAEQTVLHNQYAELRVRILKHYDALSLVGQAVDAKTYKLPPRLGHWGPQHSARVRAACPEMESVVRSIEALIAQRDPAIIAAKYGPQKRGGWRRARANRVQLNPGEWPPRYK